MADEFEAIYVAATDGVMFYGLRLAVTPEMKARVNSRDEANPIIEGTGTQLKWQDTTPVTVSAKVKTHVRYTSIAKISLQFITDLVSSGRQGDIFNFVRETGVTTWTDMDYLPVPVPQKSANFQAPTNATESTQKVTSTLFRIWDRSTLYARSA